MGYQMHKRGGCTSLGEDIEGTNCSGGKCKIWSTSINHGGLYNIICLGTTDSYINIAKVYIINITSITIF